MQDPFFLSPIPALSKAVEPWAARLNIPTLPMHIHEVLFFYLLYTFVQFVVSPVVSKTFFPTYYPSDSRGKKANWDSHVVSLFQSVLINGMALWVMYTDEERKQMDWQQRVWGYTGAAGLIQAMAAGYFVWDLVITLQYLDVFGLGLLAHALSALSVYSFGFVRLSSSIPELLRQSNHEESCRDPFSTTTAARSSCMSSRLPFSTSTGSLTN
jgi:hypothetical protein